jgi:hypothetical protein
MTYKTKQKALVTSLTHTQLADLFRTNVIESSGETVRRNYVGAVVTVYAHILSDTTCHSRVLQSLHAPCNLII